MLPSFEEKDEQLWILVLYEDILQFQNFYCKHDIRSQSIYIRCIAFIVRVSASVLKIYVSCLKSQYYVVSKSGSASHKYARKVKYLQIFFSLCLEVFMIKRCNKTTKLNLVHWSGMKRKIIYFTFKVYNIQEKEHFVIPIF